MLPLRCVHATAFAADVATAAERLFHVGHVTGCRLLRRGLNDSYALESDRGSFILRLSRTGRRSVEALDHEAGWLAYLAGRGVAVAAPLPGWDGRYAQTVVCLDGARMAMLFPRIEGREPEATPADAKALGETLARIHRESADFAAAAPRFSLDVAHLVNRPMDALCRLLADRPALCGELGAFADRIGQRITRHSPSLSWGYCHGDCHGFNARIDGQGRAIFFDFDDGGPG